MPELKNRPVVPILLVASLLFGACDSSGDEAEITVSIGIDGSGNGTLKSRTVELDIDCRVQDGEVSGTCETVFIDTDGKGTIRLEATPEVNTDFSWGSPCNSSVNRRCDIDYDAGTLNTIHVQTFFEAKTVRMLMDPPNSIITKVGDEGSIFVTAQALDEDGAEVLGVVYTWEVSDPSVIDVIPQEDKRRVLVVAKASGQAVVRATAQGVTGSSAIDVHLAN